MKRDKAFYSRIGRLGALKTNKVSKKIRIERARKAAMARWSAHRVKMSHKADLSLTEASNQ